MRYFSFFIISQGMNIVECNYDAMHEELILGRNMQLPTCHFQMGAALGLSCRVNYSALVYTLVVLTNFQQS